MSTGLEGKYISESISLVLTNTKAKFRLFARLILFNFTLLSLDRLLRIAYIA